MFRIVLQLRQTILFSRVLASFGWLSSKLLPVLYARHSYSMILCWYIPYNFYMSRGGHLQSLTKLVGTLKNKCLLTLKLSRNRIFIVNSRIRSPLLPPCNVGLSSANQTKRLASVVGPGCVADNIVWGGAKNYYYAFIRQFCQSLSTIVCDCVSLLNKRLGCDKWHFDMPDQHNEQMQSIRCCNLSLTISRRMINTLHDVMID